MAFKSVRTGGYINGMERNVNFRAAIMQDFAYIRVNDRRGLIEVGKTRQQGMSGLLTFIAKRNLASQNLDDGWRYSLPG